MLHSAVCKVHIDKTPSRGYWTDRDHISGYVEVDAKREIHVASIEAQLRCEDRGRAYFRDNEELVDLSTAHYDHFEVLWSSDPITFDTPNDGNLPKGQHKFPFTFTLPDARNLPSSYNAELSHDFNGIFWGVHAIIDRDTRLRSNYRGFGEIKMLPHRYRSFSGQDDSFGSVTHGIPIKLHRRPSFLIGENDKNSVHVEARLALPTNGLTQTRVPLAKEGAELPEVRVAVRCSDEGIVSVKEITVFIETTVLTLVKGKQGMSQSVAIVVSKECDEIVRGSADWQDLSHIIANSRIYGLPETWTTNLHDIQHKIRVELSVAPCSRPTRQTILKVTSPVKLHSEATTTDSDPHPPPPYEHEHEHQYQHGHNSAPNKMSGPDTTDPPFASTSGTTSGATSQARERLV